MNFDVKYLIRWGIPGWIYLVSVLSYLLTVDQGILNFFKDSKGSTSLALIALITALGVPIGYLIHQVSMLFGFVFWNNRKVYFKQEFELDKKLFEMQNGDKFRGRYVHLLTRVHELRALMFGHLLTCINILVLLMEYEANKAFWIVLGINLFLIVITFLNQKYFSDNLSHYKKEIKKY